MVSAFFVAILCVFFGNWFYDRLDKKEHTLTNFHRFLFSTAVAYVVRILLETVYFFIDYFVPGSTLQGYDQVFPDVPREKGSPLYILLGAGQGESHQMPLYHVDYNFLYTMIGAAVAGFALLLWYEHKSRKTGDGNGLFDDYHFPRMSFKEYIAMEWRTFRDSIPLTEYFFWWLVRACLLFGLYLHYRESREWDIRCLLFAVNCLATFIIPIARVLCFAKLFFGNISYRTQSLINLIIFFGAFLYHTLDFDIDPFQYDKFMHLLSGSLGVPLGYLLILGTRRGKQLSAGIKTLASMGFSAIVMVLWEVFEFLSDHFIFDSHNQAQNWTPDDDIIFYQIFGKSVNPGTIPLLDTNTDLLIAVISCIVTGVLLYLFLKVRERGQKDKAAEPVKLTEQAPTEDERETVSV